MSPEVLIQDPDINVDSGLREELIPKSALPCGMIACKALAEGCIYREKYGSHPAAMRPVEDLCASERARENDQLEIENLTECAERAEEDVSNAVIELRELNQLSIDDKTKFLTAKHFNLLVKELDDQKVLERISQGQGGLLLGLFDLNKLGQHNDIGGFTGGNRALEAFSSALSDIYSRRNNRLMKRRRNDDTYSGMELFTSPRLISLIKNGINTERSSDLIFRIGGDEFLVLSYTPYSISCPDAGTEAERNEWLQKEFERVYEKLANVTCRYQLIKDVVSDKKLNLDEYSISKSIIKRDTRNLATLPVTSSFSLTLLDKPTIASIYHAKEALDLSTDTIKEKRKDLSTAGIVLKPSELV